MISHTGQPYQRDPLPVETIIIAFHFCEWYINPGLEALAPYAVFDI